jgi:DNA-directed RNA polymerase beta' subunit
MATKAPVKKTRVTKAQVAEHRSRASKDMSPKWDGAETLSNEEFMRKWHDAMTWYRLEKSGKDLKPVVIDWMGRNGYDKTTIAAFKKTKDWRVNITTGSIAACLLKGMPDSHSALNGGKKTSDWLRNSIAKIIEEGKEDIEEVEVKVAKGEVYVPSIQDRLREASATMSEELDYAIDNFLTDPDAFNPKEFKVVSLLRGKGVKAAHARMIKGHFNRSYEELNELASGNADEQLREAYSHLARKNVKKLIEFYQSIVEACDQIAAEAKVLKKPRAKKVKPAEELVKKVKFKTTDDKLGVASVPPAQLIGAQYAVVYNTKTRKIGVYVAKTSAGLSVKGTSIENFTDKSTQKTLRKPEMQIREFKDQNTQKRVTDWFGKIKATEIALNGRLNAETMILKVFK